MLFLEHPREQIVEVELCALELVVAYSRGVAVGTALEARQYVYRLSKLLDSRLAEPIMVWCRVV